jgi:hypothetical protein
MRQASLLSRLQTSIKNLGAKLLGGVLAVGLSLGVIPTPVRAQDAPPARQGEQGRHLFVVEYFLAFVAFWLFVLVVCLPSRRVRYDD